MQMLSDKSGHGLIVCLIVASGLFCPAAALCSVRSYFGKRSELLFKLLVQHASSGPARLCSMRLAAPF